MIDHFKMQIFNVLVLCSCLGLVQCAGFWERAGRAVTGSLSDFTQPPDDVHSSQNSQDLQDRLTTAGADSSGAGARCIVSREPNFKKWPSVRFYTSRQESDVNYGCSGGLDFDLTEGQAWLSDNYVGYYKQNNSVKDELDLRGRLIDSQLYDGQVNTYILVHGFLASWSSDPWMCHVKDLILNNSLANVFIVDWSGGSKPALPIDYSASVADVNPVASLLAMLAQKLIELTGQGDASKFHFIGHSLGSHISGLAGYALNGTLGRITAYDPAGLCFTNSLILPTLIQNGGQSAISTLQDKFGGAQADESSSSQEKLDLERARKTGQLSGGRIRLSQASARFVLALHTDITMFGTQENVGHVDVYLNGGNLQPGCPANTLAGRFSSILSLKFNEVFNTEISCSHSYSHDQWNSWSPLGMSHMHYDDHTRDPICYPMAYQCRSWPAFKAGECGMCADWDPQCVYTGFSSHFQAVSLDPDLPPQDDQIPNLYDNDEDKNASESLSSPIVGRNDDDETANNDNDDEGDLASAIQNATSALEFNGQSKHFLKTNDRLPSCMYHYQLLIGVRKAPSDSVFYVQIPLDKQRKNYRQARVSHLIPQNTNRHQTLVKGLQTLYGQAGNEKSNLKRMEKLSYYSALITFTSLTPDECSKLTNKNPHQDSSSGKHWQACEPLKFLNDTKLKAESEAELNSVELVAINYMSGLSFKSRRAFSHLLITDPGQGIRRKSARQNSNSAPRRNARVASSGQSDQGWNNPISNFFARSFSQGTQNIFNAAANPIRCAFGSTCPDSNSRDPRKIEPDYSIGLRSAAAVA